jgi:hypothetical protein
MRYLTRLGIGQPGSADSLTALSDSDRLEPNRPDGPAGPTQPTRPESPRAHHDSDRSDRPAQSAPSSCKVGHPAHAVSPARSKPSAHVTSFALTSNDHVTPRDARLSHAHHASGHPHALARLASEITAARPCAQAALTH